MVLFLLIFPILAYSQVNHLVINEIDYDEISNDSTEFVEIYNGSNSTISLAGKTLVFVNGANNLTYLVVDLSPAVQLLSGQYLVVADSNTYVPPSAKKINFIARLNNIQNGSPDGVALVDTVAQILIDAFCYEGAMTSCSVTGIPGMVSLVEGTAYIVAADSNNVEGSLDRFPNGTDANNAATDWTFRYLVTPGATNDVVAAPTVPVLVSPANNSTGQPIAINLTWNSSANAVSYRVQVATDAAFTNIIVNDSLVGGTTKAISGLTNNTQYWWKVNAKNFYGTSAFSGAFTFTTTIVGINIYSTELPEKVKLYSNYPNPFNPSTKIRFDIPQLSGNNNVSLEVFNSAGQKVKELINQPMTAGKYEITFDAVNLSSGFYFYKLSAGNFVETKKMIVVK